MYRDSRVAKGFDSQGGRAERGASSTGTFQERRKEERKDDIWKTKIGMRVSADGAGREFWDVGCKTGKWIVGLFSKGSV